MQAVLGYRDGTGFPPCPWERGELREVEQDGVKYSVILLADHVVVEAADEEGPEPAFALSLPALYRLLVAAREAGLLETSPFPPAPSAVATLAGWVFRDQ